MTLSFRKYVLLVGVALAVLAAIIAVPVTTTGMTANGDSVSVAGVEADAASARGPVTLYCSSPASILRQTFPNWYNMEPCSSYYADVIKPYIGWGMTYYKNGYRYTMRCTSAAYGCQGVSVPPDGIRVVGVFHL